jgi:hypothetical protein
MNFLPVLVGPMTARGQSPGLLWSTNLGAIVFAVDDQTNSYAKAGTNIIRISAAGEALSTNALSSYPGVALRDAAGNFYYGGHYPGTNNGGIGLHYSPTAFFVAKYNGEGSLVWMTNVGPSGNLRSATIYDLRLDEAGNVYLAYTYNISTLDHVNHVVKINSEGQKIYVVQPPQPPLFSTANGSVRINPISNDRVYALTMKRADPYHLAMLSRIDSNGVITSITNWAFNNNLAMTVARPVENSLGEYYNVESVFQSSFYRLTKRDSNDNVLWERTLNNISYFAFAPDKYDGVHVGFDDGSLLRYDYDGNLAWSTNFGSACNSLILDDFGNRVLSFNDGRVGRLADEFLTVPNITGGPNGQTILAGSNLVLSVSATGFGPLRYYWLFNNNPLVGKTNASLSLSNVTTAQAGLYSVIVSNSIGSITSAPALLRVKSVAIFTGNQLLTNGTYGFESPPTLNIRSAYPDGSIYYTLNGSTPSFASILYSGPFTLSSSALVRAIGYSADFLQSEEADAVDVFVLINHTLTATASPGGSVSLNPPGGTYIYTNIITVTANPNPGWTFLYWLGDASGTNPVVHIPMTQQQAVHAVFGTTLSTTVAGNGQVLLYPPGGLYPYGTVVRLTGLPQPGNYFGAWGNAASGNSNPLYFTMTNPALTVSSIFSPVPSDQAALTVWIEGAGLVTVNPKANIYPTNQTVSLTAVPDSGQVFLTWSGDASGSVNPLNVQLNQSKVITANFSNRPRLRVDRPGLEGMTPSGFRFTLSGPAPTTWQIYGSSNLITWQGLGSVTNSLGEVQFTDPTALTRDQRFYRALP